MSNTNTIDVFVLMSDGWDNQDSNGQPLNALKVIITKLGNAVNPPQFFSLEIGDKIAEAILAAIKESTNGTRMRVGATLENFNTFYNYLEKFGKTRFFYNFVQELRKFRLTALDGTITLDPNSYLLPNVPCQINDKTYLPTQPDPSPTLTLETSGRENKGEAERIQTLIDQNRTAEERHQAEITALDSKTTAEIKDLTEQLAALQKAFNALQAQSENSASSSTHSKEAIIASMPYTPDAWGATQRLHQIATGDQRKTVVDKKQTGLLSILSNNCTIS